MPTEGLTLVQQLQALIQAVLEALSRSREIIYETANTTRSSGLGRRLRLPSCKSSPRRLPGGLARIQTDTARAVGAAFAVAGPSRR